MNRIIPFLLLFAAAYLKAQDLEAPLKTNNYLRPTTCDEIGAFIKQLDNRTDTVSAETIAKSAGGRNVYAVMFSSSAFGKDGSKIRILIFAQQHGNEQSGKEGALLLMEELLRPENRHLLSKADIAIIPQMNPDGSEANRRRNGDTMDLNRNHLILTEPETVGLHRFFDRYLFHVTVDAHEYFPYGETWKAYGYRNNSDLLLGTATNSDVSPELRKLSNEGYIPFMMKYLASRNISNFIYSPGGPPEKEYIRHSTFDVNDGRQSFAIEGTLSFIHEGLNGTDGYAENIKHRAESQMYGMLGLIEYACKNSAKIRKLVDAERKALVSGKRCKIAVQSEHAATGEKLLLPLLSYSTGKDTVVTVSNYRPVVKPVFTVEEPSGYLIPKELDDMSAWIERHGFTHVDYQPQPGDRIEKYIITRIDSTDFEGDRVVDPACTVTEMKTVTAPSGYIYLPVSQLKGKLIVLALEPESMLGLATYREFAKYLRAGEPFPFLRIIRTCQK